MTDERVVSGSHSWKALSFLQLKEAGDQIIAQAEEQFGWQDKQAVRGAADWNIQQRMRFKRKSKGMGMRTKISDCIAHRTRQRLMDKQLKTPVQSSAMRMTRSAADVLTIQSRIGRRKMTTSKKKS